MSSVITLLGLLQHSSFKSSVECYNYINFSVFPEQFKREYKKKKIPYLLTTYCSVLWHILI